MAGRPSKYSENLVNTICELTATTERSLASICKDLDIHAATVLEWLTQEDKKSFTERYTRAKAAQADYMAEQIIGIADDSSGDIEITEFGPKQNTEFVNRSRLRIDARKWLASKLAPKKYGDKMDHTTDGKELPGNAIAVTIVPPKDAD